MKRTNILLFLLFLWVARNTILVRQRDTSAFIAIDFLALLQIAAVFLLFISFFFLYINYSQRTLRDIKNSPILWFFLLYILGLISAFWSPLFNYSAYRAFESLVLFFAIFLYFRYIPNFIKAEEIFLKFTLALLIFTFIGQLKLYGFSFSIGNLHTNTYSLIALIMFLYSFGELVSRSEKTQKRNKRLKKYALTGFIFVALGTSAATNVSAFIGLIVLAFFTNRNDLKIGFLILTIISIPLFLTFGDMSSIQEILFPGKSVEAIESMTGRINLWDVYVMKIYENPYFGSGFAVIARISEHATTNTHNSLLSILTGMDITGGIIFTIFTIRSTLSVIKSRKLKKSGSIGSGVAFLGALINAMSVAVIGEGVSPSTLAFVCLSAFYFLNVKTDTKHLYIEKVSK